MLETGLLEEVRIEQHAEDRAYVIVRFSEGGCLGVDRSGVAWWLDRPGGHLWRIGHEELVQMRCDEAATGRLLHDVGDDDFAVEAAAMTEEFLLPVIMVFGAILELPGEAA